MDAFLYDQFAEIERRHWWFVARREVVATLLRQRLKDGKPRRILDVGCGTGGMLQMLTEFGQPVCGLDMSSEAIEYCRKMNMGSSVQLHCGALPNDMPPGDSSWDVVSAFDVIEHLDDDKKTLCDAYSVLAPGGILVVTVPAFNFLWGPHDDMNHHRRRYTAAILRERIENAGFKVEHLTYFNSLLFPAVAAIRLARRALSFGKSREPKSDFFMPSPFVNNILTRVFGSEIHVLKRASLPVGVSLFALAHKPTKNQ